VLDGATTPLRPGWEMGKGFTWARLEVLRQAPGLRSCPETAAAGVDSALQAAPTDDGKQTATERLESRPAAPCPSPPRPPPPPRTLAGPMGTAAASPPLPRQNPCRRAGLGFTPRSPPPQRPTRTHGRRSPTAPKGLHPNLLHPGGRWIAQPARLLPPVDIPGINVASRGIFVVRIFQFCFQLKGRKITHFQSAGDTHPGGICIARGGL